MTIVIITDVIKISGDFGNEINNRDWRKTRRVNVPVADVIPRQNYRKSSKSSLIVALSETSVTYRKKKPN